MHPCNPSEDHTDREIRPDTGAPMMPKGMFAQCHRMYAVNKNEVEYYDTVNRIIRIKNCPDTVEIGVTYKSVIGGLLNG